MLLGNYTSLAVFGSISGSDGPITTSTLLPFDPSILTATTTDIITTTISATESTTLSFSTTVATVTQTTTYNVSTSASPTATHKSIPSKEIAGISIGTAVIGALIALLAVWICIRQKRAREGGRTRYSWAKVNHPADGNEKGVVTRHEISLEKNLLERANDSDIRKSMQDLNEMIDQHCVNYYHLQTLNISQGDLEHRLVECGYNSPNTSGPSVAELARLLQNPRTRTAAMHHLISLLVLSHANWRSSPELSLLPSQISQFCQSIPPVESYPGSEEG